MLEFLDHQTRPLVGLSSLAEGADQLFAEILLEAGGELQIVIPSRGYENTFAHQARLTYDRLLSAASDVTTLNHDHPGEAAYDDAGRYIVEHCHILVAIWDGKPARGTGGTGSAVAHARRINRQIVIIWPPGLART